jgi:hypothetical protein
MENISKTRLQPEATQLQTEAVFSILGKIVKG